MFTLWLYQSYIYLGIYELPIMSGMGQINLLVFSFCLNSPFTLQTSSTLPGSGITSFPMNSLTGNEVSNALANSHGWPLGEKSKILNWGNW